MKLKAVTLVATLPVAALLVMLNISGSNNDSAGPRAEESSAEDTLPLLTQEFIRNLPPTDFDSEWVDSAGLEQVPATGAELRMQLLQSLADQFREAADENFQELLAYESVFTDPEARELTDYYRRRPSWPTVPALPDLAGYEIQVCPSSRLCLSDMLADEPDDPGWARFMESELYREVTTLSNGSITHAQVVCREKTCGILLPDSSSRMTLPQLMQLGSQLRDKLGFQHRSFSDLSDFQALYLTKSEDVSSVLYMQ